LSDEYGVEYLDFLSGCGSLNYGHNHPHLKAKLIEYINSDGVTLSMDLFSIAKENFLKKFSEIILQPRNLKYCIQFPGPTGSNAVEAAIKLARKVTNRSNVIAFTNGFHGCSLGSLALTGSSHHRGHSSSLLTNVNRIPYDGYLGEKIDTADMLDKVLSDPSSGFDMPAAIIFETIQGEGGLSIASPIWAQKLQRIAKKFGILIIVDDIQAGCGRSGDFFSFEALNIVPDIVCLAKSISGFGLPMSLVLIKPEYDLWLPGEHNGTFRGNNHAFITAAAALELFWEESSFEIEVRRKASLLKNILQKLAEQYGLSVKGRGLMLGLEFNNPETAALVQKECFSRKLIVELCGPRSEVLKLLPPLNVSDQELKMATSIIENSLSICMTQYQKNISCVEAM